MLSCAAAPILPKLATFIPSLFTSTVVHIIALHEHHPSFNWMDAGGEEKAHIVLERICGALSVKRAIPINRLFKSRLQALERVEADPGGLRIWINEKSGLTNMYGDHTRLS